MKQVVIILVFTLLFCSSKGQTYFNNDFGNDSSSNTIGSFIHEFSDTSGYLAVGSAPIVDSRYLMFIRLNTLGDTLWTKMYGIPNLARSTNIGKYINKGDSNIIFSGSFFPDSVTQSPDTSLAMLFNIDTAGNVLWELYYGDTSKQSITFDIQLAKDNGYIITGWTTGWGATSNGNAFLLKVDSLGTQEWYKTYSIAGTSSMGTSVDTTNDNGFIISGSVNYPGNNNDMFVLRTDSMGNVIWQQLYGSPLYFDAGYTYITKYGMNDYIFTGGISIDNGSGINSQFYLAKINGSNGVIMWSDTMGTDQLPVDESYTSNAEILANGDIVLIGTNAADRDAKLVKYDANGIYLWGRTFDKYGANNINQFRDIHQTHDKGFIICGDLTNVSIGEQHLWALKLDSMGCEIINCAVGLDEENTKYKQLTIYPNPTNSVINIDFIDSDSSKESVFKLIDITGKEILSKKIYSIMNKIDISSYPKGFYVYLLTNEKSRYSGKLIIQ